METIKKVVNGNNYELLCSCGIRNGGFYHACILLKDGVQRSDSRCNYCNRTWESYPYKTVINNCIRKAIENEVNEYIAAYKANNGIYRIPLACKEQLRREVSEIGMCKDLNELLEIL